MNRLNYDGLLSMAGQVSATTVDSQFTTDDLISNVR